MEIYRNTTLAGLFIAAPFPRYAGSQLLGLSRDVWRRVDDRYPIEGVTAKSAAPLLGAYAGSLVEDHCYPLLSIAKSLNNKGIVILLHRRARWAAAASGACYNPAVGWAKGEIMFLGIGNIVALVCIIISIIFAVVTHQATNALWWALLAIFAVLWWDARAPWGRP